MNSKVTNIFIIIISFILICTSYNQLHDTVYNAQTRIIEEKVKENQPEEVVEEEMFEGEMVEGETETSETEEKTNSYNAKEIVIIIALITLITMSIINIIFAVMVYHKVLFHPFGITATLIYCILIIAISSITSVVTIVKTDKNILNSNKIEIETQRKEHTAFLINEMIEEEDKELKAENDDESVLKITKRSTYNGAYLTINKLGGNVSILEDNLITGLNNALVVEKGSTATISESTITTNVNNSSAVFATDANTTLTLENIKINTTEENSKGIISQDESLITINNSQLTTEKKSSELFYSASKITADNIEGKTNSNFAYINETNKLEISNSKLTSNLLDEYKGMFVINTETEGSASIKNAELTLTNNTIRIDANSAYYKTTPLFYVFNTHAKINITNNDLYYGSKVLLNVEALEGSTQKNTVFTISDSNLTGNIYADKNSSVRININNTIYRGSINNNNSSQYIDVSLDKTSTWYLTGHSYVNTITIQKENNITKYIKSNGYNIYYNSKNNEWLNGKTIRLVGGGKLIPVK